MLHCLAVSLSIVSQDPGFLGGSKFGGSLGYSHVLVSRTSSDVSWPRDGAGGLGVSEERPATKGAAVAFSWVAGSEAGRSALQLAAQAVPLQLRALARRAVVREEVWEQGCS